MKNAKKLFLFALAVMLLAVVLCFNAGAVSYEGTFGANGNNLTWKVDADTATLYIDGYGDMEDFADERSTPWYEYLEAGFAYVSIGDGVTSIGDFAFRSLKADTITIPDNIEDIGKFAFNRYTDAIIDDNHPNFKKDEDGVIYTKDGKTLVYADSNLSSNDSWAGGSYRIADGVETVAISALYDHCRVERLYVPKSVTHIGKDAFLRESGSAFYCVPHFIVDEDNAVYSSDECGVLFNKDKTVLYSGPYADMFEFSDEGSMFDKDYYIIPETVKEIADYAFYGFSCDGYYEVYSILIGENVEKIGDYAFYNDSDTKVYIYIPYSVKELGYSFVKINGLFESFPGGSYVYYEGTEDQWKEIFDKSVYDGYAEFYFEHIHNNEMTENCTEEVHKCVICKTVNEVVVKDGADHAWYESYSEIDSCEEGGKVYYRCEDCGAKKSETIAPKNHVWYVSYSELYNCEDGGYVYYECEDCYAGYGEDVDPSSHDIEWRSNHDATCEKDGTKTSYCTKCNVDEIETVTDEGSALGHSYGDSWNVLLPATCYDRGVQVKHCLRCINIISEEIPMTEHTDNDGDEICDECGEYLGKITPDDPESPESSEGGKKEGNVYSFLTEFLNKLIDFLRDLFLK